MIDFFSFTIILFVISSTSSSNIGCNSHATILRQLDREGFHIVIHYLVELVVDVEIAPQWENCSLVLRENITDSFYVSPDQLSELNRTKVSRACTPQKVDVEAPKHLSKDHTVYIFGEFKRSQNLIYSHLNFPLHLRYHKPEINGGYSVASLKLPLLLIQCSNIDCKNLLKSKAPCSSCEGDLCNWIRFPYKTNNKNLTLLVPVGNLNHLWFVSPVTLIITFGGCIYIFIVILFTKENV